MGGMVGGHPMWKIIKFCNIIIKSANVDKGGGDKMLIHKMLIKSPHYAMGVRDNDQLGLQVNTFTDV